MIAWEIDAESIEIDLGKPPGLLLSRPGGWGGGFNDLGKLPPLPWYALRAQQFLSIKQSLYWVFSFNETKVFIANTIISFYKTQIWIARPGCVFWKGEGLWV